MFYLIGATIADQTTQLEKDFPKLLQKGQEFLKGSDIGNRLISWYDGFKDSERLRDFVSSFFKTTFGGFGDIYIIILIGIYFTVSPDLYKNGLLKLVPPKRQKKAKEVLFKLSNNLTKWLYGRFISMTLVFILTAIALACIGIDPWLSLAFIAGLLVFIPNFGPLIAAVPTILVALSISVNTAIITAVLFLVIQVSEGSFITPKIQNRLVKIPPALIILGQIFAGTLIGVWGLIFATPIVLVIKILIEEFYIRPMEERYSASLIIPEKEKKISITSKKE